MLSPVNNTNKNNINFTSNHLSQHRAAMFQKFFSSNPEFKELNSVLKLNKLPLFKDLCFFDVIRFKKYFLKDLYSDGIRVFFSTIEGKKPAGLMSAGDRMKYLNHVIYPNKIDLIHLPSEYNGFFDRTYRAYILNREEVYKVIENNKDIYINRLGLSPENSTEHTYKVLKKALKDGVNRKGEDISDIIGITLGFPPKNSMIFHMEKCAGIDIDTRKNIPEFKAKLLAFFDDKNFPYTNLSEKDLLALRKNIESIKEIKSFHNAIYDFVQYIDEPEAIKNIMQATESYIKGFNLDTIA